MPGGRPPKPTELKRKLGNPGKRALPAAPSGQPVAPGGLAPTAPTGLKRHGKAAWARYWTVGAPWLNATTDVAIVTRLCQAYDEREELRALVRRLGHVVWELVREEEPDDDLSDDLGGDELDALANGVVPFPGKHQVDTLLEGQPHGGALKRRKRKGGKRVERVYSIKANPAVSQLRKIEELITRYEGLCGFTPSDRSRLGLAEIKAKSKLEELLEKRRADRGTPD